ncbi:MAG TPA: DUF3501 family protein [Bacteroidota bacterium]|nr:DUF3501 family protein [Bacteroidota bacterium]
MELLTVDDIQSIEAYEIDRARMRKEMSALRALRRINISDACVLIFENRDTVRFQVQEMIRTERDDSRERIALELSCFNLLVPRRNELSGTLIISVPEFSSLDERLKRMSGLTHGCLGMRVGDERIAAGFEVDDDIACESDVLYVRFSLTDEQAQLFRDEHVPAFITACHPECSADVPLEGELRRSLIGDLAS